MLKKLILRQEIKEMLIGYICSDQVKQGERLSLPELAKDLGVSATPIREALTQLSESGIVTYIANRGFFVAELGREEADEVYQLMATLECEAIRDIEYDDKALEKLSEINAEMAKAASSNEALLLDRKFHQALIRDYRNKTAHKIIEDLRVKVVLYEYAFWSDAMAADSVPAHQRIIDHLASGNKAAAIDELRDNWLVSIESMVATLPVETTPETRSAKSNSK
ncbi:MAG: GntR family transcriptional regulator [Pseudomonadota bacterium]